MTKKIQLTLTFLATLFFPLTSVSQITIDAVYPNAERKLFMVNLEISGMKYVVKNQAEGDRYLKFYNLDHSLWKTIDCNPFPTTIICGPDEPIYVFVSLYISETLFDCDDDIEFLYSSISGCERYTAVYKEDGSSIMIADSCAPLVESHIPHQWLPIYNTSDGTKLILSHLNGSGVVYDLPCSLPVGTNMIQEELPLNHLNIYPNPSNTQIHIDYLIPKGNNEAQIVVNSLAGEEIKRYVVDRTFSSLILESGELAAGTYIYSLITDGKTIESKKIVVM